MSMPIPSRCARDGAAVVTETCAAAVPAPGVMLVGVIVQVLDAGTPLQESVTGLANDPPNGEMLNE